ncbi:MAG TPA: site-specific DNA-methyltransferase [Gemmatimonadaceae bacterium]|nr:site-specific DNA-methyltransferase [Gemmatimonadaceae bacterium]
MAKKLSRALRIAKRDPGSVKSDGRGSGGPQKRAGGTSARTHQAAGKAGRRTPATTEKAPKVVGRPSIASKARLVTLPAGGARKAANKLKSPQRMNELYYGDNLKVLRHHVKDESVDLVYLDPPFNSDADYNVLFEERDGSRSASQIKAFSDTWTWDSAAVASYTEVVEQGGQVSKVMQAFRTALGDTDMLAYLSMMAPRLMELKRVLKPTGSIFLHCDPTASHYLKMLMDAVFQPSNFRNEIVWHYYNKMQRGDIGMFANDHDVILFYTITPGKKGHTFQSIYEERDKPVQQLVRQWDPETKRIVNAKDDEGHVIYRE